MVCSAAQQQLFRHRLRKVRDPLPIVGMQFACASRTFASLHVHLQCPACALFSPATKASRIPYPSLHPHHHPTPIPWLAGPPVGLSSLALLTTPFTTASQRNTGNYYLPSRSTLRTHREQQHMHHATLHCQGPRPSECEEGGASASRPRPRPHGQESD